MFAISQSGSGLEIINEFRWYEVKIESEKPGSQTQDTSALSSQCSAHEPQQPDNHQPSQFSIHGLETFVVKSDPLR